MVSGSPCDDADLIEPRVFGDDNGDDNSDKSGDEEDVYDEDCDTSSSGGSDSDDAFLTNDDDLDYEERDEERLRAADAECDAIAAANKGNRGAFEDFLGDSAEDVEGNDNMDFIDVLDENASLMEQDVDVMESVGKVRYFKVSNNKIKLNKVIRKSASARMSGHTSSVRLPSGHTSSSKARVRSTVGEEDAILASTTDTIDLFPHQVDCKTFCLKQVKEGKGALISAPPGMGKTSTVYSTLSDIQANLASPEMLALFGAGDARVTVVIYSKTLEMVWTSEFQKWFFAGLRVAKVFRSKEDIDAGIPLPKAGTMNIYMATYDIFVRHIREFSRALSVDILVIDEIHKLKNEKTNRHKAIYENKSNSFCKIVFGLTGTPVQNKVMDMFNILRVIDPHTLGSDAELFKKELSANKKQVNDEWEMLKYNKIIHSKIGQVMFRVSDTEFFQDMFEKEEYVVCFDGMETGGNTETLQSGLSAIEAFNTMLNDTHIKRLKLTRDAIKYCISNGYPLLVFSQRMKFLETLHYEFESNSLLLHGKVSINKRREMVKNFQENDSIHVMFISMFAGSEGITLTRANRVIIADACWNPSCEEQAVARACRIGQTSLVKVYRFIAQSTIEVMISRDAPTKTAMAQRVIDDENIDSVFSKDDLLEKNPKLTTEEDDKVPVKDDDMLNYLNLESGESLQAFNYQTMFQKTSEKIKEKDTFKDSNSYTYKEHYQESFFETYDPISHDGDLPHRIFIQKAKLLEGEGVEIMMKVGPWCLNKFCVFEYATGKAFSFLDARLSGSNVSWREVKDHVLVPLKGANARMVLDLTADLMMAEDEVQYKYFAMRMKYKDGDKSTRFSEPSAVFKLDFFA